MALFGTRCATVKTTAQTEPTFVVRCLEGQSRSQGRFVYIRSLESGRMLRIDGFKVYGTSSTRRLQEEPEADARDFDDSILMAAKAHHEKSGSTPKEAPVDSRMQRLGKNMINLTKTVCNNLGKDAAVALDNRREAAILWAELDEETSNKSCWDCVTVRASNCQEWFAHGFGLSKEAGPKAERIRKLRQSMDEQKPERMRKLEEGLGKACCRVNKLTGERDCKKEYCHKAFKQKAYARMGHIMRRMHEKGHIDMPVEQRVAVDTISPHLHSDPRCRSETVHSKRADPKVSDLECVASSMVTHIADKHGISTSRIDEELSKYGLSIAKMIAQPFKVATSATQTMSNFKSNPAFADMAARLKEKRRRMDEASGARRSLRQSPKPHGRGLKSAREAAREPTAVLSRPKRSLSVKKTRSTVHKWLHNVSKFAAVVNRAAARSHASALMPRVHPASQPSLLEQSKDAIATIVSADGSIVKTVVSSAVSVSNVMERGNSIMNQVVEASRKAEQTTPARRLSESAVQSFYDQVDKRVQTKLASMQPKDGRRLEARDVGFTAPDKHVKENGWIVAAANWRKLVEDTHAASKKLLQRHDSMLQSVEKTGHLPSGPVLEEHRTGIAILDINAPPSRLGNMFRELHAFVTKRHGGEQKRSDHGRRMEQSRSAPRKVEAGRHQSMIASMMEASVVGADMVEAAIHTLESSNHHHESHMRKLADSILGAAASVPLVPEAVSNKYSSYDATPQHYNVLTELVRYVVYDGCVGPLKPNFHT